MPSMTDAPFMLCSAYGFLAACLLLHGHKITTPLQPSHSHSRQDREEGEVPISSPLKVVPFIRKRKLSPKFSADFTPP